jgi:hypothetical protein
MVLCLLAVEKLKPTANIGRCVSMTTCVGMCTEVQVKYWCPMPLVSLGSENCKFMNVILASYEMHLQSLDSSCM